MSDGRGTESARSSGSGVASGEGETSMVAEVAGTVAAETVVTPVEELGEVGDESLLANTFFSLARLFWNHTFSSNMMRSDILVSRRGSKGEVKTRVKEMGKKTVKKKRKKTKESAKDDAYLNLPRRQIDFSSELSAF